MCETPQYEIAEVTPRHGQHSGLQGSNCLVWTCPINHKRIYLALGLPDSAINRNAAQQKALFIQNDISVKMHSKLGALEKLGQHFGVFNDFNAALATLSRFGYVMTKGDRDVSEGFTWQPEITAEDGDEPTASIG
jgi:hypothetical protein